MFRGTCIGLSEYLVQIPQKKRQQNNCLYATSYIMYFLFSSFASFCNPLQAMQIFKHYFPVLFREWSCFKNCLNLLIFFQYKDFLACLKQVKRLYLHSMAYLNDITFTDIIIFFSYDVKIVLSDIPLLCANLYFDIFVSSKYSKSFVRTMLCSIRKALTSFLWPHLHYTMTILFSTD